MWNSDRGLWITSHNLSEKRIAHTSWTPDPKGETYLIGGSVSPSTTEIVKEGEGRNSSLEFYLKKEIRLFIDFFTLIVKLLSDPIHINIL